MENNNNGIDIEKLKQARGNGSFTLAYEDKATRAKRKSLPIVLFIVGFIVVLALCVSVVSSANQKRLQREYEEQLRIEQQRQEQEELERQRLEQERINSEQDFYNNNYSTLQIEVLKKVNIRTEPNTNSEILRVANEGEFYDVYEVRYSDYTWYRIGYNEWLASNGSWVNEYYYGEK